jgi:flagellar export protein FliJ
MPFRFSLETVLHFRKSVEEAERATLQQIAQAIAGVQENLRKLDAQGQSLRERRNLELSKGLAAAHLQEWNEKEDILIRTINGLKEKLQQLEVSRQKQLVVFQNAHRDRELLSRVREQRRKLYLVDEARNEQKQMDDLFLLQLMREKNT